MADALQNQATNVLAVLRHTSHEDKANILGAYIKRLEARSNIAIGRAVHLIERGWSIARRERTAAELRLVHPCAFYQVHIQGSGDAEFWLKRVRQPHRIEAQDEIAFTDYLEAIDRREQSMSSIKRLRSLPTMIFIGAVVFFGMIFAAQNGLLAAC